MYNQFPFAQQSQLDENSLSVRISGGEAADREFLTDVIASTLNKNGFEKVHAVSPYGFATGAEQHKPKSVLEQVAKLRPDLFKKEIFVAATQEGIGPVTFSATTKDGTSFTVSAPTSAPNFVKKATDFGDIEKMQVTGKDARSVLIAARQVMDAASVGEITLKVEREPWMQPHPYEPPYYPPVSALPPLNPGPQEQASA